MKRQAFARKEDSLMLQTVWQTFLHWVYAAGYPGVTAAMCLEGLGVPFPGDAVMAFYGFLAAQGHFSFFTLWIAASFGCFLGSLFAFWIGRRYGLPFLLRFGRLALVRAEQIRQTERFSRRYGIHILLVGRFLPGVRTLSSYFAAIGGMSWPRFLCYSLLGFLAWCFLWVGLGYYLGEHWRELAQMINRFLLWLTAGLILFLTFVLGRRRDRP
jgi:membrane protein DedA with SNARE-associated domain